MLWKSYFLLLFLIPIVSFGQTYENPNPPQPIKIEVENKSNPYAIPANNARQSSGVNLKGITAWNEKIRAERLQKYIYGPSKKTVRKLYKANKALGLPFDEGILEEHMKKWLPEIDVTKKVVIKKKLTKDEAIKEVKELKDLLNLGIITQEEFDKRAAELKKVILGN